MTHALQINQQTAISPEAVIQHLTPSLLLPLACKTDRDAMQAASDALSAPANRVWILARVAALLSPYYEKDTPQSVKEMEAEDWLAALEGQPEWAITKAVRWWKGGDNDRRHKRPFEGDIADRVKVEMTAVRAANIRVKAFDDGMRPKLSAPDRQPVSDAAREAIMREAGMTDLSVAAKPFPATGEATA